MELIDKITDIVFPKKNEEEFSKIAEKLGIALCFACNGKEYSEKKGKFESVCTYNSVAKDSFVISDNIQRETFENPKINLIFNLEKSPGKDMLHQRASGFNHVLAKICRDRNKMIGFNFNLVLNADKKERARILGRMMQNVRLCRKYKVKKYVGSFANEPFELRSFYELRSFGVCIGMNPGEIKTTKI
jgi:RNase P/RNase MRP subunit p30